MAAVASPQPLWEPCDVCGLDGDGGELLVCEACEDAGRQRFVHVDCLPAAAQRELASNPDNPWFCSECRERAADPAAVLSTKYATAGAAGAAGAGANAAAVITDEVLAGLRQRLDGLAGECAAAKRVEAQGAERARAAEAKIAKERATREAAEAAKGRAEAELESVSADLRTARVRITGLEEQVADLKKVAREKAEEAAAAASTHAHVRTARELEGEGAEDRGELARQLAAVTAERDAARLAIREYLEGEVGKRALRLALAPPSGSAPADAAIKREGGVPAAPLAGAAERVTPSRGAPPPYARRAAPVVSVDDGDIDI